jgi:hypothetical protein
MLDTGLFAQKLGIGDAVHLVVSKSNSIFNSAYQGTGQVINCIYDKLADDTEHLITITITRGTGSDDVIDLLYDSTFTGSVRKEISISSFGLVHKANDKSDMCIFFTESERIVCFITTGSKKILVYDYTNTNVIDLPFYPKGIVAHVNRIFAIDIYNKLWWCRAGDIYTWYGLEEDDDYFVTSQAMANGALSFTAQPDVTRPIMFTITQVGLADTYGSVAIVGTAYDDTEISETRTLKVNRTISAKSYKSITSMTISGHTAAGTADNIKVGIAAIGTGYVQEDQGYWTLEEERKLTHLATIGGNLYVFSDQSIYVFRGYSAETFSLERLFSGFGEITSLTEANGILYFNNYGTGTNTIHSTGIYEFDGRSYPRVISNPVLVNGSVSNYVYGGIYPRQFILCADKDYVYACDGTYTTTISGSDRIHTYKYYIFDIKARSWWPISGLQQTTVMGGYSKIKMVKRASGNSIHVLGYTSPGLSSNYSWQVYRYIGSLSTGTSYMMTKVFTNGVSEDTTLTEIVLQVRAGYATFDEDDTARINIYYNTLTWGGGESWTLLKTIEPEDIPYELTSISIPLRGTELARVPSYSLKIEYISAYDDAYDTLEIYAIEQRYRVIGRSR